MSVRRGSGAGDLQIRTIQGANRVDHTGAANFTEVRQSEILSLQPPPGRDWEVHQISFMGDARTRNAVDENSDTAQALQGEAALTFGDDIVDDLEAVGNVRPGNVSPGWLKADDHVLHASGQIYPAQTASPGDSVSGSPPVPWRWDEDRDYADVPKLMLEDTEELSLLVANDNAIGNDYGEGGEVSTEYVASVQVAYIPRES